MPHKEILEGVCGDCPKGYCTLKEILLHGGMPDRTLVQLKVIEVYKWDESQAAGYDIGWQEAHRRFIEGGHAELFAIYYDEDRTFSETYKRMKEHIQAAHSTSS